MKRFISLLVALVLLVSMFALPMLALAEGNDEPVESPEVPAREVKFSVEAFKKYIVDNNKGYFVEMGTEFKLNLSWVDDEDEDVVHELLKDEKAIHALFPGDLHYLVMPEERTDFEEDEEKLTITYKDGKDASSDAEGAETATVTDSYYAGQYVTLRTEDTFDAEEGYEFVGWLVSVTYDGNLLEEGEEPLLYRAGDQFVMPEEEFEIVAYWYQKEVDNDDNSEAAATAEQEGKREFSYHVNDIICLEYCSPSDDPKNENWASRVKADADISVKASGFWMFRFVVIDGEADDISDDDAVLTPYNTDEFKAARLRSDGVNGEKVYHWEEFTLTRYAVDTSNPEIALSSSMKSKMENGLTVGATYSISTSLTITDSSNTTVTYKVYRQEATNGAAKGDDDSWKLIYDSSLTSDERVTEGYESYITASGTINPQSDDVTTEGNYRYKIVYSVKDANGYFGVAESDEEENGFTENGEFHPTMYLGVELNDEGVATKKTIQTWKIILFVIAGLSAVGIVVLLFIKPKQEVVGDSRVSGVDGADDGAADDTSTDDTK
ncbi:MAG: hypothetical protein J1F66_04505 [Clostridiales bacterium]|nr:hypothetical protein [Clostridiales bacterium]